MKYLPAQLLYFFQNPTTKRNLFLLTRFFLFLAAIVTVYSITFHLLMLHEGRNFSWITGFYWTLTVMSTLGFGDITFSTDLGLFFTLIVLLSGVIFLLIMLPFTFIQFFYAPWLEAQEKTRTPRELPEDTRGHVILTNLDPITSKLIQKLKKNHYDYVIVADDLQKGLELHDAGYKIVIGELEAPETYERLRIDQAALVVLTNDDLINTSISFTIREITDKVPIAVTADNEHSLDILKFPGNTHVFQFMKMLGESLGRKTLGVSRGSSIIGKFDQLHIAEAPAMRTSLEGKTLAETELGEKTGITVIGLWERGIFKIPQPEMEINSTTVLVLAGTAEQIEEYDNHFTLACADYASDAHVLILGGGRVGCAVADALDGYRITYNIIEKKPLSIKKTGTHIHGDAADINTLRKAGIEQARTVIITTHNDPMNIYLTFYCRQLRPDIQIISRSTLERNVTKLHRAGADLVMSYASLGTNSILNLLQPHEISAFTEGLNAFNSPVHPSLAGKSLIKSQIRQKTGCSVIAINHQGKQIISPDPHLVLEEDDELILVGTIESEKHFFDLF